MKTCTLDGCDKQRAGWGYCQRHYKRMKKTGTTDAPVRPTLAERFWAKVEKTETCWNWTGSKNRTGYGNIARTPGSGSKLSHRVSYEMAYGPIPDGMDIDHMCFNHACVNPAHLRAATRKQNMENLSGPTSKSTSGVLGVTWVEKDKAWRAQVMHNGKNHFLGRYSTLAEAESVVIAKRLELFTHNNLDRQQQQAA
jgi:hypothetical protein